MAVDRNDRRWSNGGVAGPQHCRRSNAGVAGPQHRRRGNGGVARTQQGDQAQQPQVPIESVIAVVGPFRSGTSCVAGALHALGVSMGDRLVNANSTVNERGFFEAIGLKKTCMQCYRDPLLQELAPYAKRVKLLRQWVCGRRDQTRSTVGAKYSTLCLMVPEMVEAWPRLKIVTVTRKPEDAAASAYKTKWWPNINEEALLTSISKMLEARDADIAKFEVPVLNLQYEDVIVNAKNAIDQLVTFASITPSPEQVTAATTFIDQTLNHHA